MTDINIFAQVRGLVRQYFPQAQADVQPVLGDGGEQIIMEGLPPLTEIVRLGNSWQMIDATGSAALAALPTTTSMMTLNNLDSANGKSLVIEEFGTYQGVIDATQINSSLIVAMMNKKGSAQGSAGTVIAATQLQSLSGKGVYGGAAAFRRGATVANDIWFPHSQDFTLSSPTLAGNIFVVNSCKVRGLYIVPPGGSLSWHIIKSVAGAAAQHFPFYRWHEVQLNLG